MSSMKKMPEDFDSINSIRTVRRAIRREWPELDGVVSPCSAADLPMIAYMCYVYARYVVKGPWAEGEACIASCQGEAAVTPGDDGEVVPSAEKIARIAAMYSDWRRACSTR